MSRAEIDNSRLKKLTRLNELFIYLLLIIIVYFKNIKISTSVFRIIFSILTQKQFFSLFRLIYEILIAINSSPPPLLSSPSVIGTSIWCSPYNYILHLGSTCIGSLSLCLLQQIEHRPKSLNEPNLTLVDSDSTRLVCTHVQRTYTVLFFGTCHVIIENTDTILTNLGLNWIGLNFVYQHDWGLKEITNYLNQHALLIQLWYPFFNK